MKLIIGEQARKSFYRNIYAIRIETVAGDAGDWDVDTTYISDTSFFLRPFIEDALNSIGDFVSGSPLGKWLYGSDVSNPSGGDVILCLNAEDSYGYPNTVSSIKVTYFDENGIEYKVIIENLPLN